MINFHLRRTALMLSGALLVASSLVACGGGDDDSSGSSTSSTTGVPASAQQSTSGMVAYLGKLIDESTNDTSEPVLVGDAVLPTDDTTELN